MGVTIKLRTLLEQDLITRQGRSGPGVLPESKVGMAEKPHCGRLKLSFQGTWIPAQSR